MTTIDTMPAKKTTTTKTETATAPDDELVTAADPEPTPVEPDTTILPVDDPPVDDEPPGSLGDRFAAAVRAVGDGASGVRIEQILAG